jgi:hypothetical protein
MKITHPLIIGLCLAICAGGAVVAADTPTGAAVATLSPANLVINKSMHFPAADGGSAALDAGNYLVVAEPKGGLQLISAAGKTLVIAAAAGTHGEKLAAPRAVIVAVGDDERHLVLLLPDGKRLEAIGSLSGIGSRGLARPEMASNMALQTAVLQAPPVQIMAPAPPPAPAPAILKGPILQAPRMPVTGPAPYTGLVGWADLHVHLMINIAFGGKLIHGAPDEQSLMPSDIFCNHWHRAGSVAIALSDDRPTHGGWDIGFQCGDAIRPLVINALEKGNEGALVIDGPGNPPAGGFPDFLQWPKWNDIAHQKMWWEWLRRGRDNGQRVMVALATNNRTLGDAASGPGDGPTDDKASADLQLMEIKMFVGRHPDFMEVAYGAADIQRIVLSNRIAVVLGIEIDNIGNFNMIPNPPRDQILPQLIPAEVQRLYNEGVRYVLPIHVSDSLLGGTAIYQDAFNTANYRETGHFWMIECADVSDNITHTYIPQVDATVAAAGFVKLGLNPFVQPPPSPVCPGGQPNKSSGHRNMLGLTNAGAQLIKELMKRGMIVDIDHMSQKSADSTLDIAESFGYPIMSGHAGIRGWQGASAENSRTPLQLQRISRLHGMFGLGTDGVYSRAWAQAYQLAILKMGYLNPAIANYQNGAVAFGTDLNGLVKGPMPGGSANRVVYDATFPKSGTSGSVKTWDYNSEGVAHYGMLADFIKDVRTAPSNGYVGANGQQLGVAGPDLVDNHLMRSADYFWHTWQQAEAMKGNVH